MARDNLAKIRATKTEFDKNPSRGFDIVTYIQTAEHTNMFLEYFQKTLKITKHLFIIYL